MTFFYRGKNETAPNRSPARMRLATSIALVAYPIGCAIQILYPDTTPEPGLTPGEGVGMALVALALFAFAYIAPTYLQRITGEETKKLDELELSLRQRAYTFAYQVFAGLTLVFAIYMGLSWDLAEAGKLELWRPVTYDHWSALFWGAGLYAAILPTAYLAWIAPAPLDEEV